MGERFTAITFEVYISGSWVDLTDDVRADPAPTFSRGIGGNAIEDRVADPGRLRFSLDNSASNSAGKLGYYSPGHADVLTGWTTSLPVRLTFSYDTWQVVKWAGRIEPDGIQVIPGTLEERRVDVTCVDYMGLASRHKINLLTLETDKYLYQGVQTVLSNMPIQPQETDYADESTIGTMPVIFDYSNTDTTAASEFQKLAASQRFAIVVRGGGVYGEILTTHYTRGTAKSTTIPLATASSSNLLMETGDALLLEDGSNLLLDEHETATVDGSDMMPGTDIPFGKHVMNYLTVVTYPRETDAAATTVLWELEQAEKIAAGESLTLRGAYTDPNGGGTRINGTEFVDPLVSGTDYKANAAANGTGADLTASLSITADFGAAEVDLVMTNTGGTDLYVGGGTTGAFLQVRGKGIRVYDPVREIFKDQTSIDTHGVHPYTIEMKYSKEATESTGWTVPRTGFGQGLVNLYKDPVYSLDRVQFVANKDAMNMSLFLFTEPMNQIKFNETVTGIADWRAIVQGYEATIQPGGIVMWNVMMKRISV